MRSLICLLVWLLAVSCELSASDPRKTTSLNGEWKFRRDDQKDWKPVTLPTHWETHEGLKFDGVGWYERTLPALTLPLNRRLLLHFDAVATHTTVYWNDVKLGEHLGAWTPFRFDVTEHVKKPGPHTIQVRVDEKVGHNTQGFLPIIAPHFGGIWQGVKLVECAGYRFDDGSVEVMVDPSSNRIKLHAEVLGASPYEPFKQNVLGPSRIKLEWRAAAGERWHELDLESAPALSGAGGFGQHYSRLGDSTATVMILGGGGSKHQLTAEIGLGKLAEWSPTTPSVYEVRLLLHADRPTSEQDEIVRKVAFRTIETKGDQFLLNGQPLSIRGVLNWGYYPPSLAPTPTEEQWRSDLRLIKSWGFNLMKCCLWVPPQRLLEIADEEGVLIWLEYPTWHPKLTPQYRQELMQEYREFHQHDRHHPSVILRSLTCETGPGADLKVIQDLYDQCKKMSGGLVVDDSSWIQWNRVCDFYDDHPYGNNHTWVATLTQLKDYIAKSKLGVKPLCLGEAIAADTWVPTGPLAEAIAKAKADPKQAWSLDERGYPFWVPGFFDANKLWLERMAKVCGGPIDEKKLQEDSLRYAWLMRKYQIETYRREVPNGGYVVSVMRDFPLASMGLVDYLGKPKWKPDQWSWHGHKVEKDDYWYALNGQSLDIPIAGAEYRTVTKLDAQSLAYLERGGKVLLQPDGKPGSFPTRQHWFLRGGPFVNPLHPLIKRRQDLHKLFVEQQHLGLAGDVVPEVNYLEEIDPILMLWDNHDIKEVKTHGIVFETRVGKGRLMVSTLMLLDWQVDHLVHGPQPRNALKPETIARLRAKLNEKKLDLTSKSWQFQPDGKNAGLTLGWHKPNFDATAWKPIRIARHWEGEGYPALDGWAWYRLQVDVPKDWPTQGLFLNTEGVDDAYELYVNGTKIGAGGDIPSKQTAFEERKSHPIPAGLLKPGEPNVIAIRVYDWYGAGGIHRPVTLSNIPLGGADLLR